MDSCWPSFSPRLDSFWKNEWIGTEGEENVGSKFQCNSAEQKKDDVDKGQQETEQRARIHCF